VRADNREYPRIVEGSVVVEGSLVVEGSIVAEPTDVIDSGPLGALPLPVLEREGPDNPDQIDTGRWRAALAEQSRRSIAVWRPPITLSEPVTHRTTTPAHASGYMRRHRLLRRVTIAFVLLAVLVAAAGPVIDSPVGAWGADALRATLGPQLTAQIEAYYFNAADTVQQWRTRLFGASQAAPWSAPHGLPAPTGAAAAGRRGIPTTMRLPSVALILTPALAGEGEWSADALPGPTAASWPAPLVKTFLRPDPARPYAVVTLVAIDLRQVRLHVVDGTSEPASGGPGVVPAASQQDGVLLAAFNGGYKAADGHYGLMTGGRTYLPPQPGAATLALYADGTVALGAWGTPAIPTQGLIAYRQNGDALIADGVINPSTRTDGYAWGAPILANIYTWRSALAMTSSGVLIYAAGNAVSANTLARALLDAGAVSAMQLDINPTWVRFDTYSQASSGGSLVAHKLRADMYGGPTQFLTPYPRDFMYITRSPPPAWRRMATGVIAP
jgi:hypothetical protein